MVLSCILYLQGKSKYKFIYPASYSSHIRSILSNVDCPRSQHVPNRLCPRVSQLFLPSLCCLCVVVFSLSTGGWRLCCSLQGRMALWVGKNVYLAIKQWLFWSHSVCQVQRRARFQGSVDINGNEYMYFRVLTPLASAFSHQHQLKQTVDLWSRREAEQSPLFHQDLAPLQAGRLVYIWCVHHECVRVTCLVPGRFTHKMLQAYDSVGSLQVPAYQVASKQILSHLFGKADDLLTLI